MVTLKLRGKYVIHGGAQYKVELKPLMCTEHMVRTKQLMEQSYGLTSSPILFFFPLI